LAFACAGAGLALAGCASTTQQDVHEPSGNFQVRIVSASFPASQDLAKTSRLVIRVKNDGSKTVPNIAMTVNGFDKRSKQPELANPERPQFVINGHPQRIAGLPESKDDSPKGCETVYVNTWACGPLKPGADKTFAWKVTAVQAGPYKVSYRVAAGLNGKAKAVAVHGGILSGSFAGEVSAAPPQTRVSSKDGKTVIRGERGTVVHGSNGTAVVEKNP
jgi:hypothetical protein